MFQNILLVAAAVAAASFTITTTSIFLPVRERISKVHPKLEELIHCPWCLGHYITFGILLLDNIQLLNVSKYWIFNYFLTAFAVMGIVGLMHYVLLLAYKPVTEHMLMRKREQMQMKIKKAS